MIWNKNKECMSRDEMSALQGKRLNKLVNLVYHNVPFYRNKMQEMDLSPDDIQTIEDIVKLPFTTKQYVIYVILSIRSSRLLLLPKSVRVHASSGTTGILPLWDIRVVTCLYGPK